jgi:hypothetical protein
MTETISSQRPNPCNGCEFRYPACSATCTNPEKLKWEEEQEKIRRNRKDYMNNHTPIWKHGDRDSRKG